MTSLAFAMLRLARSLLPPRMRTWGEAALNEAAALDRPSAVVAFAFGCLMWAAREAMADRISQIFQRKDTLMILDRFRSPQGVALLCAAASAMLGLTYLTMARAPAQYLLMNVAAFTFGLVALAGLVLADRRRHLPEGAVVFILGAVWLATALLGVQADGVKRWLALGPLTIQPSLMALPLMTVLFARSRDAVAMAGMTLAALAVALQPDRGTAGALVAGVAGLAIIRPNRNVLGALVFVAAGFAVTLVRPDPSPVAPFVDRIFYSSFEIHPLAGMAVLVGAILLIVPALLPGRAARPETVAFGLVWIALILAAALGNYPTPVVGYGGSAVIGYLVALLAFPGRPVAAASSGRAEESAAPTEDGRAFYVGVA